MDHNWRRLLRYRDRGLRSFGVEPGVNLDRFTVLRILLMLGCNHLDFRRHLQNSPDDHVLDTAELLVIHKRNGRVFVFVIEGQLLPIDLVLFLVEFLDSRLGGKVGNDLVDSCLDLLRQISVYLLSLVLIQLLSQLHKQEL